MTGPKQFAANDHVGLRGLRVQSAVRQCDRHSIPLRVVAGHQRNAVWPLTNPDLSTPPSKAFEQRVTVGDKLSQQAAERVSEHEGELIGENSDQSG